jgi:hypothetical protein
VCVFVYPSIVAGQLLGKNPLIVARQLLGRNATAVTNTRNKRRIVGRVVFNVARVISRKVGDLFFPELLVLVSWCGVTLSPLSTSATNWPIVPASDDR